jgi:hypothetical protein
MAPHRHLIAALALGLGTLGNLSPAQADGVPSADGRQTSSSLDFRIIIPAVLQVVENSYPLQLPAADAQTGRISAVQHLVLLSTLRKGFCMELRLAQPRMTGWQLQASGSAGIQVQPSSDGGYRVCASRAGRYNIALQHAFSLKDNVSANAAPALSWPVYMDLAAL